AKDYADRGVAFVGICPCDDSAAQVAKQAKDFELPFAVFKDEKFAATDALKAEITPEAFVLDGQFYQLRYRGRIDNSYAARLKKNNETTKHDLKTALDELLAGKEISEPITPAVGCAIVPDSKTKPATGKVTYYRDVMPLMQQHCQTCHRPGEVGPY